MDWNALWVAFWGSFGQVWGNFVQFLHASSLDAIFMIMWTALVVHLVGILLFAIFRKSTTILLWRVLAPLIIWIVAWAPLGLAQLVDGDIEVGLLSFYKLLVLISFVWAFINLIRLLTSRGR